MNKLAEKFPKYIIVYKSLTKKISNLEKERTRLQNNELEKVQIKIKKY